MKDHPGTHSPGEAWRPLPHLPPDTFARALLFRVRLFFDPEVRTIHRDLKKALKEASGKVLEIGCGLQPYRHLLDDRAEYHALDWERSEDCFACRAGDALSYDGSRFPYGDETFDLVFHTEVLEHVENPAPFLSECFRVLNGQGRMLFTVPFAARYHYIPCDYWRFTPAGLIRLLQDARFTDIEVVPRGNDIAVAMHKLNSLCYRLIFRDIRPGILRWIHRACFALLFAAPVALFSLAGHLSILLKAGSPDDPLGYTVNCRKGAAPERAS